MMQETKPDFVFGTQSVLETLRSGKEIEKLLVLRGSKTEAMREAIRIAKSINVPCTEVPKEKFDRITKKNHQGMVCFVSSINYYDLDNIISECFAKGKDPFVLILDGVTDVRNLGAIARTAECVGIDVLVVPKRGSAQITSDAMKTSSGALNFLKVARVDRLLPTLRYLQDSGLKIVSCTEKTTNTIYETSFKGPMAIILGDEETGISTEVLERSNERTAIPMVGKVGSLNVSAAASVILYEALRQRISK
jgi:23S rRNA (guanosine2251-2'-O)-methyltransferase